MLLLPTTCKMVVVIFKNAFHSLFPVLLITKYYHTFNLKTSPLIKPRVMLVPNAAPQKQILSIHMIKKV